MSIKTLAVKYRPQLLEDIVGQYVTTTILQHQIDNNSFKRGYLFIGKSGCGKTTTARAFANAIGCSHPLEIDAATHGSADNIRELANKAKQTSAVDKYNLIILDEVHVFSKTAWSALLKVLEDCPPKTVFILCTTEQRKIPATILNRVQSFVFKPIPGADVLERLVYIADKEKIPYTIEGMKLIVNSAMGGMRTAIAMMERVADYGMIEEQNVRDVIDDIPLAEHMVNLAKAASDFEFEAVVEELDVMRFGVADMSVYLAHFRNFLIDCTRAKVSGTVKGTSIHPGNEKTVLKLRLPALLKLLHTVIDCMEESKFTAMPFEVFYARMLVFFRSKEYE